MTGSHEVRGSIPLGSTNSIDALGPPLTWPFVVLCAYSVPVGEHVTRIPLSLLVPDRHEKNRSYRAFCVQIDFGY